jgi:hypothetical protein
MSEAHIMIAEDTAMADIDTGTPEYDRGLVSSDPSDNEMADSARSQSDDNSLVDRHSDSNSDIQMSDRDDEDSDSDEDKDLFPEDQVSYKQFTAVHKLAWRLDATDTAAADLIDILERMKHRDHRRELTYGPMHSDKEGETRVCWLMEERAAFKKFVDIRAAELQRMEDDIKPSPLQA